MREIKKNNLMIVLAVAMVVVLAFGATVARGVEYLDDKEEVYEPIVPVVVIKTVSKELRERFPPEISEPSARKGGGAYSVKAEIGPGDQKAGMAGASVCAQDGAAWTCSRLMPDRERPKYFSGVAPAGEGVLSARAWDEKGRASVQASCPAMGWPPEKLLASTSCLKKSGAALEKCVQDATPIGCFFPLATEELPVDDKPGSAGDDLDMIESYFGYDDKYLYGIITVQKAVSPGSLTPPTMHHYGFTIMDPRQIVPASDEAVPQGGIFARYTPLGLENKDFITPCAVDMDMIPGRDRYSDTANISCSSKGPFLFMKIDRAAFGFMNSRELVVIAHTGILSGLDKKNFSYINRTPPTMMYISKGR